MLSLIELQSKKDEAKRKKYDKDEMDAYLELVFENYRQLLENNKTLEAERNELSQKVKKLSDGVQYYRSIETTLQKALILAEKTSKETKDAALLKAEAIEKDANKKADEIIRTAEGEYNKIKGKCVQLVQQFNQYKTQLIEAASAQLEMVERDEFDITNADDYEQRLDGPFKQGEPKVASVPNRPAAPQPVPPMEQPQPVHPPVQTEESDLLLQEPKPKASDDYAESFIPEDILIADTIDLGATLGAVRSAEEPILTESSVQAVQTNVSVDAAKIVEPTPATIVEPVMAKPVQPKDAVFESEIAAHTEMEPPKPSGSVPTLDTLLQDLNLNNKNNQKSDDPFEFLGSTVDDF